MSVDTYAAILKIAAEARWNLDEASSGLLDLDFERPFLPEDLVHADRLSFLTKGERAIVSQIRARAYLGIFVVIEKFTLPFVMTQAANCLHGDGEALLALMGLGQEEAKHITLFERYATAFDRGFDSACEVVGPAVDITAKVLMHHRLAVGITVQHFEWLSQSHYVRAARADHAIDERFKNLLRLHWREEAQHAQLDALVLANLAELSSAYERERAVNSYLEILDDLSGQLHRQVEFDLSAFERAARPLDEDEREHWRREQARSYDEVFIRRGLEHPAFRSALEGAFGRSYAELDEAAHRF